MTIPLKKFTLAILWFLVVTILLTLPGNDIPKISFLESINFDKVVHIGLFCGLVFLFYWPVSKTDLSPTSKRRILLKIALTALAYGIMMEFVQKYFIPNRSCDVKDMIADGIGAFLPYVFQKKIDNFNYFPKRVINEQGIIVNG